MGKTALAIRAAWDVENLFPDGCLFLDLQGHTPGSAEVHSHEVLDRLLHLLGVPGEDIPRDTDGRANLYRDRLRGRRMLLVFDNVRSAGQVTNLLPAEPRCGVLITRSLPSQRPGHDAVHVCGGACCRRPAPWNCSFGHAGERVSGTSESVAAGSSSTAAGCRLRCASPAAWFQEQSDVGYR